MWDLTILGTAFACDWPPAFFFVALGVVYAASLSNRYLVVPNGVRYSPDASARLAAGLVRIVLIDVAWNLWRGSRQRQEA